MTFLNQFFFDIYPYIAGTIFIVGSILRYDYGQYTWRASSSQLLSKQHMRLASNLFHIGIIGLFFGHFFGLLTPPRLYESFLSMHQHQIIELIGGGIFGAIAFIGAFMLLLRRILNSRVRITSTKADILIIFLIFLQICLGLATMPFSYRDTTGIEMLKLIDWAQSIITFKANAGQNLIGVDIVFKIHMILGMTLFLIFPFCRLVHIWSVPIEYLTRKYQLVRNRH